MEKKYLKTEKRIWFYGIGTATKNITGKDEKGIDRFLCWGLRNKTKVGKVLTAKTSKLR